MVLAIAGVLSTSYSCGSKDEDNHQAVRTVVEQYLTSIRDGDLEKARSYWTDINDAGDNWTMIALRDMTHVTQGHLSTFAGGFEIIESRYKSVEGLQYPTVVLELDVRGLATGHISKLEAGLVRKAERWYIYCIYPGRW